MRTDRDVRVSELDLDGERLLVISVPLPEPPINTLSEAEGEIARAVIAGQSNGQIAAARGRSARTIANQLASIYRKLGVGSRAELAAWAAEQGFG